MLRARVEELESERQNPSEVPHRTMTLPLDGPRQEEAAGGRR